MKINSKMKQTKNLSKSSKNKVRRKNNSSWLRIRNKIRFQEHPNQEKIKLVEKSFRIFLENKEMSRVFSINQETLTSFLHWNTETLATVSKLLIKESLTSRVQLLFKNLFLYTVCQSSPDLEMDPDTKDNQAILLTLVSSPIQEKEQDLDSEARGNFLNGWNET